MMKRFIGTMCVTELRKLLAQILEESMANTDPL